MDHITRMTISGLFGRMDHTVNFRTEDRVTILTGVNGSGKTHVLNALNAVASRNFIRLRGLPFDTVDVRMESGRFIRVTKFKGGVHQFKVEIKPSKRSRVRTARVSIRQTAFEQRVGGDFWVQLDDDTWMDRRDNEIVTSDELLSRYGMTGSEVSQYVYDYDDPSDAALFEGFDLPVTTLVEIRRLDQPVSRSVAPRRTARTATRRVQINQYVEKIKNQINDAKRESLAVSQKADRDFAIQALKTARSETIANEMQLRERYQRISDLNAQLQESGLMEGSMSLPSFPRGRLNETERRIMAVFLSDWMDKLAPLVPVQERIAAFRNIFDHKLTGKHVELIDGEVKFWTDKTREELDVSSLSSGEQHLLALFTMLLFTAEPGGLVLIDEPEISLHAAWKESFLSDLTEVAEATDFQVVIATHSTSIISGRWDLTEELISA